MSAADVRIADKRDQAEAARDRLLATVDEIKLRLAPKTLAQEAWDGAKHKGVAVADTAVTSARERPALAAGIAAGAAVFLARKPIFSLLTGLFSDQNDPDGADLESEEKKHGEAADE